MWDFIWAEDLPFDASDLRSVNANLQDAETIKRYAKQFGLNLKLPTNKLLIQLKAQKRVIFGEHLNDYTDKELRQALRQFGLVPSFTPSSFSQVHRAQLIQLLFEGVKGGTQERVLFMWQQGIKALIMTDQAFQKLALPKAHKDKLYPQYNQVIVQLYKVYENVKGWSITNDIRTRRVFHKQFLLSAHDLVNALSAFVAQFPKHTACKFPQELLDWVKESHSKKEMPRRMLLCNPSSYDPSSGQQVFFDGIEVGSQLGDYRVAKIVQGEHDLFMGLEKLTPDGQYKSPVSPQLQKTLEELEKDSQKGSGAGGKALATAGVIATILAYLRFGARVPEKEKEKEPVQEKQAEVKSEDVKQTTKVMTKETEKGKEKVTKKVRQKERQKSKENELSVNTIGDAEKFYSKASEHFKQNVFNKLSEGEMFGNASAYKSFVKSVNLMEEKARQGPLSLQNSVARAMRALEGEVFANMAKGDMTSDELKSLGAYYESRRAKLQQFVQDSKIALKEQKELSVLQSTLLDASSSVGVNNGDYDKLASMEQKYSSASIAEDVKDLNKIHTDAKQVDNDMVNQYNEIRKAFSDAMLNIRSSDLSESDKAFFNNRMNLERAKMGFESYSSTFDTRMDAYNNKIDKLDDMIRANQAKLAELGAELTSQYASPLTDNDSTDSLLKNVRDKGMAYETLQTRVTKLKTMRNSFQQTQKKIIARFATVRDNAQQRLSTVRDAMSRQNNGNYDKDRKDELDKLYKSAQDSFGKLSVRVAQGKARAGGVAVPITRSQMRQFAQNEIVEKQAELRKLEEELEMYVTNRMLALASWDPNKTSLLNIASPKYTKLMDSIQKNLSEQYARRIQIGDEFERLTLEQVKARVQESVVTRLMKDFVGDSEAVSAHLRQFLPLMIATGKYVSEREDLIGLKKQLEAIGFVEARGIRGSNSEMAPPGSVNPVDTPPVNNVVLPSGDSMTPPTSSDIAPPETDEDTEVEEDNVQPEQRSYFQINFPYVLKDALRGIDRNAAGSFLYFMKVASMGITELTERNMATIERQVTVQLRNLYDRWDSQAPVILTEQDAELSNAMRGLFAKMNEVMGVDMNEFTKMLSDKDFDISKVPPGAKEFLQFTKYMGWSSTLDDATRLEQLKVVLTEKTNFSEWAKKYPRVRDALFRRARLSAQGDPYLTSISAQIDSLVNLSTTQPIPKTLTLPAPETIEQLKERVANTKTDFEFKDQRYGLGPDQTSWWDVLSIGYWTGSNEEKKKKEPEQITYEDDDEETEVEDDEEEELNLDDIDETELEDSEATDVETPEQITI